MNNIYAEGQRWLSENETELGLGVIQSVDHRLVSVYFPANEAERTYAKQNAPLARVTYQVGDQIETVTGEKLTVEKIEQLNDILVYLGRVDSSNDMLIPIPETQLSHHLKLNQASDRLFSGQVDSLRWFELRYAAMQAKAQQQRSEITGLQGPRVDLIGHQLFIADEVGKRFAPRVLLADEVGLGKTIEAGMIIHQQLINHRVARVLIVVPQPLVNQWFVEMIRRFNLHFSIFDEERIDSLREQNIEDADDALSLDQETIKPTNPFLSEQLVLCSLEFLNQCNLEDIKNGEWDLLVVDEAHHLEWRSEGPSESYLRVESIALNTPGLLLLSATPEQLGQESHFARLRLLDPDRFHSLSAFIDEQNAYQPIAQLIERIIQAESWDQSLIAEISTLVSDVEICEANKDTIIKELLDRNGTGRVLYRNTRKNIQGFPKRKLIPHPLANCPQYIDDVGDHLEDTVEQLLHPETQYVDESWTTFDPRIEWLHGFLKANRQDKVLIICALKETAIALDLHCRFKLGFHSTTFHEDMDIIARDRAAANFADMEEGAQVLICSEIGSEGRNFQFSHKLVLLDLPANPDLLEQRIGRLDRIGQQADIEIHVPFMQNTAQEVIFNWYHLGMNAFESTNTAGSLIFKQTKADLFDAIIDFNNQSLKTSLLGSTQKIAKDAKKMLEAGRDKLLELSSFNAERAEELIERVAERDSLAPRQFLESCWDRFGIQYDDHSSQCYVVRPGDHMFVSSFPTLPEDGMTVTYDRNTALSRDDVHFLTWEHPMVTGVIDLILSEDKGNACVCVLKNKGIKPGTLLMEVLYHIEPVAPKQLLAQRFLPFTTVRVLTDINGVDLDEKVSHKNLSKQCQKIPKNTSRQVIKSEEKTIRQMLKNADGLAQKKANSILENIVTKMQAHQNDELNRLKSLQKKNPNIREEEINFINEQTDKLTHYLSDTQLQLEAIRLIVAI